LPEKMKMNIRFRSTITNRLDNEGANGQIHIVILLSIFLGRMSLFRTVQCDIPKIKLKCGTLPF
jgi:hypothetical protein